MKKQNREVIRLLFHSIFFFSVEALFLRSDLSGRVYIESKVKKQTVKYFLSKFHAILLFFIFATRTIEPMKIKNFFVIFLNSFKGFL